MINLPVRKSLITKNKGSHSSPEITDFHAHPNNKGFFSSNDFYPLFAEKIPYVWKMAIPC